MTPQEARSAVQEYARSGSQHAFARIVRDYVDLVHAAALRQLRGDTNLAEDVTQAVFIVLARKAKSLGANVILSGWLVKTARFCANDAMKRHYRQVRHEREAASMRPTSYQPTTASELEMNELLPHLDQALSTLSTSDRNAVVMRYLEKRSLRDVSTALGTSEEAAKKRVSRAVGKLRLSFVRVGSKLNPQEFNEAMDCYKNPSAPPALATTILASVFAGKASVASVAIADGAMQMMRSTKWILTAAVGGAAVLAILIPLLIWQFRANIFPEQPADQQTSQRVSR